MMTGITLDLSINLTSIIGLLAALVTFVTAFNKLSNKIDLNNIEVGAKLTVVQVRLLSVEDVVKDTKSINSRIAVVEVQQNINAQAIAQCNVDIHDLRMGKGRIVDNP